MLIFGPMVRIAIIGGGNLAANLLRAVSSCAGMELVGWASRKKEHLSGMGKQPTHFDLKAGLPVADLYILAVSDKAIGQLARALDFHHGLVVHTSGAQPLDALKDLPRTGVFYPLQTFSKSRTLSLEGVPLLLEVKSTEDLSILHEISLLLGGKPVMANSQQRLQAHLAAVIANNFSNHMWYQAEAILEDSGLSRELLTPILQETLAKFELAGGYEAQTGPARRGDGTTLERHQGLLGTGTLRTIYDQMTQSIAETYGTEL